MSRQFQKLAGILPRAVGDAPDILLVIERGIFDGRKGSHVDPGQRDHPPFPQHAESFRNQTSCRRKDDGAVDLGRRLLFRSPGPRGSQPPGKFAMFFAAREHIHLATPMSCHLDGDMGGASEAVEAKPLPGANFAEPQRAVANHARAKQRRSSGVRKGGRKRVGKVLGDDGVFGVAAIGVIAGEARRVAQIFLAATAKFASSARPIEPRHAHSVAFAKPLRAPAPSFDNTHNLVARNDGQFRQGKFAFDSVEVGMAKAAGFHANANFLGPRLRHRPLARQQRLSLHGPGFFQNHRLHHYLGVPRPLGASRVELMGRKIVENLRVPRQLGVKRERNDRRGRVLIRIFRLLFCSALFLLAGLCVSPARALAEALVPEKGLRVIERNRYPELSLDGRPFFPHSAIFFYYRTPRSRWAATLDAYRRFGINTIDLYIPWNWHQPQPDVLDLDGQTHSGRDLRGLMALLREKHLSAIVRIGPVILNEWRNGGYPDWLLERPEFTMPAIDRLEGRYPPLSSLGARDAEAAAAGWLGLSAHLEATQAWYRALMAELAPHLASRGGPILLFQLDDDQGNGHVNYAGPKFWEYLERLADMAASAGGEAPFVINPIDMRVPAAGCSASLPRPIASLGQWYLRGRRRVNASDRTEMEYFVEELKTQPCFVAMLSEFQAGWYAPGDDSRPPPIESASTLLASRLLLSRGLRGLTYFPLQDTVTPAGYEVPWANRFYRWDAAFDLNGERRERAGALLRNGRLIHALGEKLAATHLQANLGVVDLTASLPQASLSPKEIREIAANLQRALRLLEAMGYTGELVDAENQPASQLERYPLLLVLLPPGTDAELIPRNRVSEKTQKALANYAAGGGQLAFLPGQPPWPVFRAAVSKHPVSPAARIHSLPAEILSWVDPSWSDAEIRRQAGWSQTHSGLRKFLDEAGIERHIIGAGASSLIATQLVSNPPSRSFGTAGTSDSRMPAAEPPAAFGFLSVTNMEEETQTESFSVRDPGSDPAGAWLELREVRVPARDSLLLPLRVPLCASGDCPERIRSSTLELCGIWRRSKTLSLAFYVPERGAVELELPQKPRRVEVDDYDVKFEWDGKKRTARFALLRGPAPYFLRYVAVTLPYSLKEALTGERQYPPPEYDLLNALRIPLDADRSLVPRPWILDRSQPPENELSFSLTAYGEMPVAASVTYEGGEKAGNRTTLNPDVPGNLRLELKPTEDLFGQGQVSLRIGKEKTREALRWIRVGRGKTAAMALSLAGDPAVHGEPSLQGKLAVRPGRTAAETEYFLESERLRLILSPAAGGRVMALMDKSAGTNWVSSVGGLRDFFSFYEQPPGIRPERARGIGGLHNRAYHAEILEAGGSPGGTAALRLSYVAPEVLPAGARVAKTLRLNPETPHRVAIEYEILLEKSELAPPTAGRAGPVPSRRFGRNGAGVEQSFISGISVAAGGREPLRFCWQEASRETCQVFPSGETFRLPAPVRALRVHRAEGDAGLEVGWEDEARAAIEIKNFSAMIRLRFPPLTPGGPPGRYRIYYSLGLAGAEPN